MICCQWCDEEVDEHDVDVVVVPFIGFHGIARSSFHRPCYIRSLVGSIGHQLGRCSCHGGNADDPPGLSRRQAAVAAYKLFASARLTAARELAS